LRLSIQHITRIGVISRRAEEHNHQTHTKFTLTSRQYSQKTTLVPHIMSKMKCIQHVNGENKDGNEVLTISPN
jgi:hypothetical protein